MEANVFYYSLRVLLYLQALMTIPTAGAGAL